MSVELLILQATPFCNINCEYCYLPDRTDKSRMSLDTVRSAARFVREMDPGGGRLQVSWHAGEPLVVPIEWYAEAHQVLAETLDRELIFAFQTNGTLVSDAWIAFVKSDPRVHLNLSLDGPAYLHDVQRRTRSGRGTHALAVQAARRLRDAGIPFGCIAVVTDRALDVADDFYDFFADIGPSILSLNAEQLQGANRRSSLQGKVSEARYRRFLRRLCELWLDDLSFDIREFFASEMALASSGLQDNQLNVAGRVLSIGWQGDLHTFSPELLGELVDDEPAALGRVQTDTWETVVRSEKFRRLAQQIEAGRSACRQACRYFAACGGGSPSNKLAETGSFAATETLHCRLSVQAPFDEYLAVKTARSHARETPQPDSKEITP